MKSFGKIIVCYLPIAKQQAYSLLLETEYWYLETPELQMNDNVALHLQPELLGNSFLICSPHQHVDVCRKLVVMLKAAKKHQAHLCTLCKNKFDFFFFCCFYTTRNSRQKYFYFTLHYICLTALHLSVLHTRWVSRLITHGVCDDSTSTTLTNTAHTIIHH